MLQFIGRDERAGTKRSFHGVDYEINEGMMQRPSFEQKVIGYMPYIYSILFSPFAMTFTTSNTLLKSIKKSIKAHVFAFLGFIISVPVINTIPYYGDRFSAMLWPYWMAGTDNLFKNVIDIKMKT